MLSPKIDNSSVLTDTKITMKNLITFILNRAQEQSSWRGAILILTALGLKLEPQLQEGILAVGLSAVGLINLLRKEK